MANLKYIIVGIIVMIIGYKLYFPYEFFFGVGTYALNSTTFWLELGTVFVGFYTLLIGIAK
jgi:hypothetical protein